MYLKNIIENKGPIIAGTSLRSNEGKDFNICLKRESTTDPKKNREILFDNLGLPLKNAVFANQVHEDNIHIVDEKDKGKGVLDHKTAISACDGLITSRKNLPLCILTADCYPIFIYDPEKMVIANLHAGWKGTNKKILVKAIKMLKEHYHSNPEDLILSLGPGIQHCEYEVSEDFKSHFSNNVLYNKENKFYLDLLKENINQGKDSGIKKDNILWESSLCTASHSDKFYSYRKEGKDSGRMISYIALK